jgi:hypothetical protein
MAAGHHDTKKRGLVTHVWSGPRCCTKVYTRARGSPRRRPSRERAARAQRHRRGHAVRRGSRRREGVLPGRLRVARQVRGRSSSARWTARGDMRTASFMDPGGHIWENAKWHGPALPFARGTFHPARGTFVRRDPRPGNECALQRLDRPATEPQTRTVLHPGRPSRHAAGPGQRSASMDAVATTPSTRRARSASRVISASACSCVSATYSAS